MTCRRKMSLLFGMPVALAFLGLWLSPAIQRRFVATHQRSVTESIADWGKAHAKIANDADALEAERMVDYIKRYYPPGPGYQGTPESEETLEDTRRKTILQIEAAIAQYRQSKGEPSISDTEATAAALKEARNRGWTNVIAGKTLKHHEGWSVFLERQPGVPGGHAHAIVSTDGRVVRWEPGM